MWENRLIMLGDVREQLSCELAAGEVHDPSPFVGKTAYVGGNRRFVMMAPICALIGIAMVDGSPATIVGRRTLVDLFLEVSHDLATVPKAQQNVCRMTADTMLKTWRPARHERSWAEYIDAQRVRHKVAELFPEFRIWPADPDYDPDSPEEVQLRPRAGGRRLGGIIFPEPLA